MRFDHTRGERETMPVYVDNMRAPHRQMIMCHMVADSIAELLAMADHIGVARRWFQLGSHPHFDIALSKRALAIAAGAIEVDRHGLVAAMKRHRELIKSDQRELAAIRAAHAATITRRAAAG
jgi:hypothetical protein